MTNTTIDDRFIERLRHAAKREMSEEELRRQKVSFILGTVGRSNDATQAEVESVLAKQNGKAVS